MKPLFTITLAVIGCSLFFTSCIEDAIPKSLAYFSAQAGDSTFTDIDSAQAYWVQNYFNITAEDGGQTINISIVDFDGPGTYVFDDSTETPKSAILAYQINPEEHTFMSNAIGGHTGSVIISAIDTTGDGYVNGVFGTYARRTSDDSILLVTNGIFDSIPVEASLPPTGDNYLRATIDGTAFEAGSLVAGVPTQTGQLSIIGSDSQGSSGLGLFLPSDIGPGTYSLDGSDGVSSFYSQSVSQTFQAQSGTITIIAHDQNAREISGTFTFTVTDVSDKNQSIAITAGSFLATY